MNEWQVSVEKKLTAIKKDIEYIKARMPVCDKAKHIAMIKFNRALIIIIKTAIKTITTTVLTK